VLESPLVAVVPLPHARGDAHVADRENYEFALEDHIAGEVGERVRSIISAAESAAGALRHEAEQQIQARRRLAEAERMRYLETARREADELLRQRVSRMTELSDALIEGAAKLLADIQGATELRRSLDRTVVALAENAEELLAETRGARAPAGPAGPQAEQAPEPEPVAATPEPAVAPERSEAGEPVDAEVVADDETVAAHAEPQAQETGEPGLRVAGEEEGGNGAVSEGAARAADDDALAARLVALQMAVAGSSRGEVEQHLRINFELGDTTSILNDVFGSDVPGVAR
jgi:hypothetical protein